MSKKETHTYVLVERTEHYSTRNGTYYIKLLFLDVDDSSLLECSVDPAYRNWNNWDRVVNDPQPLGIYGNLHLANRRNKDGQRVVSADSHPRLLDRLTQEELILLLEAL